MSFNKDLVQSLSQVLLQHLNSEGNSDGARDQLAKLLLTSLNGSITTPSPPCTPSATSQHLLSTPQGTALVRTPSVSSVRSSSSVASSRHDWTDDDEVSRRRHSTVQEKRDTKTVTNPILSKVDSPYLSPHPEVKNTMFRHKFQKRTRDGQRILKKKQRHRHSRV